jgi:hypothetical protein
MNQQIVGASQLVEKPNKFWALPCEGRGQGFESLRVRQIAILDRLKKSIGRTRIGAGVWENERFIRNGAPAAAI